MNQDIPVGDGDFGRLFIDHPLYELNPQSFCLEIERVVKEQNVNYLAAVTIVCEQYEIDYAAVPKLITETMKDKIEMAAEERNLFHKHKAPTGTPVEFFTDIEEE